MPSWGNACETIPSLYRHFERKREIFFRSRSSRRCEDSGIFVSQPSPQGEGAPKGRIGQERYERERGRSSQVRRLRKYPIHRWRGPPSPMGKAKRRRLRRKKESQPRLAALLAPSKGRGSRGHALLPLEGERIAHSPYRHPERSRGIFLAQRYASHMLFRGNDALM